MFTPVPPTHFLLDLPTALMTSRHAGWPALALAALLLILLGSPTLSAQTARQAALNAAEAGISLTADQKALLRDTGYTFAQPQRSLQIGDYALSFQPNQSATVPDDARLADLLVQDFSAGIPATWTTSRSGAGTAAWTAGTNPSYGGGTNTYVGWNDDAAGSTSSDQNLILQTPSFSSVGATDVVVTFDYSYRSLSADRYALEFSTDGGTTWQTGVSDLPSTPPNETSLYPVSTDYTVILPAAAVGQADLRLRWRYTDNVGAGAGWNWYGSLDNVRVTDMSSVTAPQCATVAEPLNGATGLEGLLRFRATAPTTGDAPTGYKLFLGTDPAATSIANGVVFTTPNVVLSGTVPSTTYYWRFVPTNAAGDATGCATSTATTKALGTVAAFPYTEDFGGSTNTPGANGEVAGAGELSGWYNRAGGSDFWRSAASADAQPAFGASMDHTDGTGRFGWLDDSEAPIANNAQWWTPSFDLTGLTAPRLRFWYQNAADGATPAEVSILNVLVSTNGGSTFALALTVDTVVNAWAEYVVDLTPYASANTVIAFNVVEAGVASGTFQFQSDPSLDDVRVEEVPTAPVFAITPDDDDGAVDFGTAGICASDASTELTFTISNAGVGTLSVTSASLTGADAGAFSVDDSQLPETLATGESVEVDVTFEPTAGPEAPLAATLQVAYNDGSAQTASIALAGTRSAENVNGGTGAGIDFANDATGACAASSPAPLGTALLDIGSHTRVTDWTDDGPTGGDDSYFTLDETILDALGFDGLRLFGETDREIHANSNGYLTRDVATAVGVTLPTTTGGGLIAVANMDLDLDASFAADDTGEFGAPGLFYGSSDVDSDGETDLIVTWWHAYDFGGSDAYPSALAEFITAQLIVFGGPDNEDSRLEIRLPDGVDGNGVPYQQNVNTAPVRDDLVIGLSNPTGTASSEYHENLAGGVVSDGDGVAIRFTPETQAVATGAAGWRQMAVPVTDYTVERLAELNLVQGVPGQYPDAGANLFTGYDGTAFTLPTAADEAIAPGQGFFWYLYDLDIDPEDDSPETGPGTSNSYALPMALQGTGAETAADPVNVPLTTAGDGSSLIGNPFRSSLDLTDLGSWVTDGALLSSVGQIWDGSGYALTSAQGDVVSAWQGMWVENDDATALDVPASAQTTGGTFVYREGDAARLAFELSGTATDGTPTLDRALAVELSSAAQDGWDLRDASKLQPLLAAYATAAFQGERDGEERLKAQESRAPGAGFEVPVVIDAVGTAAELTLRWPTLTLDADVPVTLRDLVTGAVIDLRAQDAYTFSVAPSAATTGTPAELLAGTSDGATRKAGATPRFVLAIGASVVAGEDDAVTAFALDTVRPNPTRGTATVRFAMPDAGTATVELYDLLGRRVATLAQGDRPAGWHELALETSSLSAGVYVVRMQAEGFAGTQRVTVLR